MVIPFRRVVNIKGAPDFDLNHLYRRLMNTCWKANSSSTITLHVTFSLFTQNFIVKGIFCRGIFWRAKTLVTVCEAFNPNHRSRTSNSSIIKFKFISQAFLSFRKYLCKKCPLQWNSELKVRTLREVL